MHTTRDNNSLPKCKSGGRHVHQSSWSTVLDTTNCLKSFGEQLDTHGGCGAPSQEERHQPGRSKAQRPCRTAQDDIMKLELPHAGAATSQASPLKQHLCPKESAQNPELCEHPRRAQAGNKTPIGLLRTPLVIGVQRESATLKQTHLRRKNSKPTTLGPSVILRGVASSLSGPRGRH